MKTWDILGLSNIFHLPFGTISGGQKQLVNITTCLVQPEPTLIFLDEPMAALDEVKAQALLRVIKELPTEHAFIVTAHMCKDKIENEFDRIIKFDDEESAGYTSFCKFDENSIVFGNPLTDIDVNGRGSIRRGLSAMVVLWHGQYSGWPKVEIVMLITSLFSGVVLGLVIRGSLLDQGEGFSPFRYAIRLPLYFSAVFLGLSTLTSLGVASVYGENENKLLKNFVSQRSLHPLACVGNVCLRSIFFGCLQTAGWFMTLFPIVGFGGENTAILFVNTAIFCTTWTCFSFWIITAVSKSYSVHAIVLINSFCMLVSGAVGPWETLDSRIKAVHYIHPMFYFVASSTRLILDQVETGCPQSWKIFSSDNTVLVDKNFPSHFMANVCAPGVIVFDEIGLPDINSLQAQGFGLAFTIVSCAGIWLSLRSTVFIIKEDDSKLGRDRVGEEHEDAADDHNRPSTYDLHTGKHDDTYVDNPPSTDLQKKAVENVDSLSLASIDLGRRQNSQVAPVDQEAGW